MAEVGSSTTSLVKAPCDSAPFVIFNINMATNFENSDGVQKRGGNMEGA